MMTGPWKNIGEAHKGEFTLQRYKGLGEMDADQLWETTLNPENRVLKRVEIEDAVLASQITELLMGSDVPPRKKFIYDHADEAEIERIKESMADGGKDIENRIFVRRCRKATWITP